MKCKLFFSLLFISISISAQNNIEINRKSLAYMAVNDSDGFTKLVDSVNKS